MKIPAKKTMVDGIVFDSKFEADRYLELKVRQQAGLIKNLKTHTTYKLELDGRPLLIRSEGYPNGRKAQYTDDFSYDEKLPEGGYEHVVEDCKGYDTQLARYRRAVFELLTGQQVRVHMQAPRKRKARRR